MGTVQLSRPPAARESSFSLGPRSCSVHSHTVPTSSCLTGSITARPKQYFSTNAKREPDRAKPQLMVEHQIHHDTRDRYVHPCRKGPFRDPDMIAEPALESEKGCT